MDDKHGIRLGIVGARGYVGAELITLIAGHPRFELAFVSSRELAGQKVSDHNAAYRGELRYTAPSNADLPALGADAVVLALPNGKAADCVAAFDAVGVDPVIIDLSADYRFDEGWYYGLPELTRSRYRGERRISNFLLWQLAYSELYFSDLYWPDFKHEAMRKALADFATRQRRFGKTSEQVEAEARS